MAKLKAFVMSHGHMDIEWNQPLHSYRFWLIEALDRLEKIYSTTPDMISYTLDGQIFPLEEYLEIKPEKTELFKKMAQEKKVFLGPFYTQFDEWIPSGEMMVRNCLWGDRLTSEFGTPLKVGYLPDNFGHPTQLPQILNQFGIDNLLFQRGMPYVNEEFPDEFVWEGIDGSKLISVHFREGYSATYNTVGSKDPMQLVKTPYYSELLCYNNHSMNAIIEDPDASSDLIIEKAKRISAYSPSGSVLIVVGGDHLPPSLNIEKAIKLANEKQNEIEFINACATDYFDELRKYSPNMPVYSPELIGSRKQFVLLGALSTRSYLKRENFASEALFEKYAEPIYAIYRDKIGADWDNVMKESLRLLMINHAHDSIHGSSIDCVHDEMMTRYGAVKQNSAGVISQCLKELAKLTPYHTFLSYTPTNSAKTLHQAHAYKIDMAKNYYVESEDGKIYPCQLIGVPAIPDNGRGKPHHTFDKIHNSPTVMFNADGEMSKLETFVLKESDTPIVTDLTVDENRMENEFLIVEREGATFNLTDKISGKKYYDLNLLKEQADVGDYWDTSETWQPSEVVYSNEREVKCEIIEKGPVRATMKISGEMDIPERCINGKRSIKRVLMPFSFEVSLLTGSRRVDVKLTIDNTAYDHKVLLYFAPGVKCDTVTSQNAFTQITRNIEVENPLEHLYQPATKIMPFREYLLLRDGKEGIAIASKGLYDYEAFNDYYTKEGGVLFTLFRGVGDMSVINVKAREELAASSLSSKSAQCQGEQVIEFSYIPFEDNNYHKEVNSFLYPALANFNVYGTDKQTSFDTEFAWKESNIVFSARTISYNKEYEVLRFFENEGIKTDFELKLDAKEVYLSNLNEEIIAPLEIKDKKVKISVKPNEIVTLLFKK